MLSLASQLPNLVSEEERHPTTMRGRARIHKNVWDNWNGYIGRRKVFEIGASDIDAAEWLVIQTKIQGERHD